MTANDTLVFRPGRPVRRRASRALLRTTRLSTWRRWRVSRPEEPEKHVQLRTDRHPENQLVLGVPEAVLGYLAT